MYIASENFVLVAVGMYLATTCLVWPLIPFECQ
jgi:hypothetical protein